MPPPSSCGPGDSGRLVTLGATAVRVGKWAERAAFNGRSLWVSESGARSIVEIDLQTRAVGRRLKVGRLPVDMVATENGTVYALSETDNMIYALARSGNDKAGEYAEVPRCADLMAYADNNLWVVSNLDCSTPSVLTRVSHLNGRTAKVADLQGSTSDIKAAHGFVYVGHMATRRARSVCVDRRGCHRQRHGLARPADPLSAPRRQRQCGVRRRRSA